MYFTSYFPEKEFSPMQVLCMVSNDERADVTCSICGQKYAVYYSRRSEAECESALLAVQETLLKHHVADATEAAHKADCFNVPEWNGPAHMSGAALLSGAPVPRPFLREVPAKVPTAQRLAS
jgi:hypothetical protein